MTLILGIFALVLLYFALQGFRAANPAIVARGLKIGGGIVTLAAAAFIGLRGELAVAIPLGIFGAGLLGWSPAGNLRGWFGGPSSRSSGQSSRVRSSFLEMLMDHDSGTLSGRIVAGAEQGRSLDEFDLHALLALRRSFDDESRNLLDAYLDRRFARWREDAQGDAATGSGRAASGKMTDEEAYQILGLQPGASLDDITLAHRTLMKKIHPDQGGTTYLAARVNEAKETLVRRHHN
jgi:DnaJ domain